MPGARVAVVIPCLDAGPALRAAVRSALGDEDTEVVVVDDGSTDPVTLAVMRELEGERVRLVRQPNRGPADARNRGAAVTSAPYVLPLDADDELKPGAVAALADELDRDPAIALVWGLVEVPSRERPLVPAARLDAWLLTYVNQIPSCTLVRRDVLEHVGGWRGGIEFEDWDLWLRAAAAGFEGRRIDVVTYRYHLTAAGRFAAAARAYDSSLTRFQAANRELIASRARLRRTSTAHPVTRTLLPLLGRVPFASRIRDRAADWIDALATRRASPADLAAVARSLGSGTAGSLVATLAAL